MSINTGWLSFISCKKSLIRFGATSIGQRFKWVASHRGTAIFRTESRGAVPRLIDITFETLAYTDYIHCTLYHQIQGDDFSPPIIIYGPNFMGAVAPSFR